MSIQNKGESGRRQPPNLAHESVVEGRGKHRGDAADWLSNKEYMMSYIIPDALKETMMKEIATILENNGYEVTDTSQGMVRIKVEGMEDYEVRIFFKQSSESGGWRCTNFGFLHFGGRTYPRVAPKRRLKVIFTWERVDLKMIDHTATAFKLPKPEKLLEKTAELYDFVKDAAESKARSDERHTNFQEQVDAVFDGYGKIYYGTSTASIYPSDSEGIDTIEVYPGRATLKIHIEGSMEEIKAQIQRIEEMLVIEKNEREE